MSSSTQLKAILIIFCLSFGHAAYSPLAKWIFVSENLIDDYSIKELINNNASFQAFEQRKIRGISCSCLNKDSGASISYYAGVVAATRSISEYGISVWMKIDNSLASRDIISVQSDWSRASGHGAYLESNKVISFYTPNTADHYNTPSTYTNDNTWMFLAYYFVWNTYVSWTIYSPSIGSMLLTSSKNSYPGNIIIIAADITGYFYEIQAFKKAGINSLEVTLYDNSNNAYIATTSNCYDSSIRYCHSEYGYLSTANCQCPIFCTCSNNNAICTSCRDPNRDLSTSCKNCKTGYVLDGSTCVLGNFYSAIPNCAAWISSKVCTKCNPGYFLYDQGSETSCVDIFYIDCSKSCTTCSASPYCYECVESVVKDGNSCRAESIGYQISFQSPNIIVIAFAHPLPASTTISNFKVTTKSGEDIPVSNWQISSSSTASNYQIITDLVAGQIPINIDFEFEEL